MFSHSRTPLKSQVFNLLNLMIGRMGDGIQRFAADIVAVIPHLWAEAREENLLRQQVI